MYVIGTAGHVDHGKSTLVQALTGINPDRLREEQERGVTIELGFAWLTLPSGREVSIVDVPGHVRFVRHMLAGAGAIDLALFVIAADEGVMPQTREHLEILDLLGVRHGVIALTKADTVDADWMDLVEQEIAELFADTSLAGSPLVRVSAVTGAGLDELQRVLDAALDAVPPPRDIGRPRFGIDRVFTMPGFGTVVTGTLLDGHIRVGDTLESVPGGHSARVRGLQTHRREIAEAMPGTRVAINLAATSVEDVRRGEVLAPPGRVRPTRALDTRLRALAGRALTHNLRVTLHLGTAEVQARLRVLGADEIAAGESGWCQLVLAEPIGAIAGDQFVIRVSDDTVGGGQVLDPAPPRHRRSDPAVAERLAAHATGAPEGAVLAALERLEPATARALAPVLEITPDALSATLDALVVRDEVLRLTEGTRANEEPLYLSQTGRRRLAERALRVLDAYYREHPLRLGMPREELRAPLGLGQREFAAVLPHLAPEVHIGPTLAARPEWQPSPTAAQRREADQLVTQLTAARFAPPRLDVDPELLAYLRESGRVVDCGDGVLLAAAAFADASALIAHALARDGTITLAGARDLLDTNRRATQAVLETLDRRGVTRRAGEARVLAADPTPIMHTAHVEQEPMEQTQAAPSATGTESHS